MSEIFLSRQETDCVKVTKYKDFSGPNAGRHGPEKTPYLETFHIVTPLKYLTSLDIYAQ